MAKTTKAVARAKSALPPIVLDFSADVGGGIEGTDRESYAIPFLRVVQKDSPVVRKNDPAYQKEAEVGMLYNTVTQTLYDGDAGLIVLPAAYQRRFIQWAPRSSGGGFKGEHLPEEIAERRASEDLIMRTDSEGKSFLGSSDEKNYDKYADTRSHFMIVYEPTGALTQVNMSLSSTQIKKSKQLMSMLAAVRIKVKGKTTTPPTWMNRVRVTTVFERNDQGSWYGLRFALEGFVTNAEAYDVAKNFHDTVLAGNVRTEHVAEGNDKF